MSNSTTSDHQGILRLLNHSGIESERGNFTTAEGGVFSGHSPLESNLALFLVQVRNAANSAQLLSFLFFLNMEDVVHF